MSYFSLLVLNFTFPLKLACLEILKIKILKNLLVKIFKSKYFKLHKVTTRQVVVNEVESRKIKNFKCGFLGKKNHTFFLS